MEDKYHVLPINDIHEHLEIEACPCKPKIILESGKYIIVHNSYDGRETKELIGSHTLDTKGHGICCEHEE